MNAQDTKPAAFIGIDWADQKHDISIHPADKSTPLHEVIESKPEAVQEWILKVRDRYAVDGSKIYVCIEQSKGAFIYQLMAYDFFVLFPINPKSLASFREAFSTSGAKGDPTDADLLAEIVELHSHRLKAWRPDDEQTRKLAAFCKKRRDAVQAKVRLVQQVKAELKNYYPFALELLDERLDTPLACDFLTRWPTFESLQRAKAPTLRRFFYARHCRDIDRLNNALARLASAVNPTKDSAIIDPAAANVRMLARQLRAILPAIDEFDKEIGALYKSHPNAEIFASFPGAGEQLAPRLLTGFGTDPSRIESAVQMSVISGIAPVREASGKTCVIHRRWACPKFLRQSFHEFAACSLRSSSCQWAKAYYDDQRKKGKRHHTAVRSLAFKWIRILFACWKSHTPYSDALYNEKLRSRGSAFACA